MSRDWDMWLGDLALTGVDPRRFDLVQLLAAYEATLRRAAKDEQAWNRTRSEIYAPPKGQRQSPQAAAQAPAAGRLSVGDAEAMLSRMAAADAAYG